VRRRRRVLWLTSVGAFMAPLDGSIVSVALPKIGPALSLQYTDAIWVQASYLLVISVLLIPFGRLADYHGRMRYYLAGVVVFALGSLASALSLDGLWMIAARSVQGAGGALLGATSAAIVTAVFPPQERGRVLGINVMAVYLGLSAGPVLGGLIVTHASWRWIFLINLPIALVTLLAGWSLLRAEDRDRGAERGRAATSPSIATARAPRVDVPGTVLLGAVLTLLLVPVSFASFWGWGSARVLVPLACSAAALFAFVLVEDRVRDPVLDLDLVRRNRLFAMSNLAALLNYTAMYGVTILTAVYLEIVQGRSAQEAGLILLAQPILMAALSPLAGRLSDRIGFRIPATGGMLVMAAGMAQLALLPETASSVRTLAALATVGIGMAAFSSPNTSAVMGSVDRSQLSVASGFLGTMRFAGQGLSIALLGTIAASYMGPAGGRVIFLNAQAAPAAAADFATGYHLAMLVGALLGVAGAGASLTRGQKAAARARSAA
jgi:EmrB/QacA subfamily drug resistance transporter